VLCGSDSRTFLVYAPHTLDMQPSGQLKQRTVAGRTITLHQLKNTFREIEDTPFMYEVRVDGAAVGDPVFRRPVAEDEFDATVRGYEPQDGGGGQGGGGSYYDSGAFGVGYF
jgi:hypothetical protein